MSVPYQAIKMRRQGWGIELSSQYHGFGVSYCERAENKLNAPTLFDMDLEEMETEIVDA